MAINKEKMAEVLQILSKMDEKDLGFAEELIKARQGAIKEMQAAQFPVGTKVTVSYPRGEQGIRGTVSKNNRYTVVVRGDDGKVHRVDPSHLKLLKMSMA
tara:strand:+ start:638 stop:937 length:300 start_codon:yes stop_codon:yes gene_type:complete